MSHKYEQEMDRDVYLSNGDYIVVTMHRDNGASANAGASIEMFECI